MERTPPESGPRSPPETGVCRLSAPSNSAVPQLAILGIEVPIKARLLGLLETPA